MPNLRIGNGRGMLMNMLNSDEQYRLTLFGSDFFAPHNSGNVPLKTETLTLTDAGIELDTTAGGSSLYGPFGSSRADSTVDCWVNVSADYDKGTVGTWGAQAYRHAGVVMRYLDADNFAVAAMISIAAGEFQVVDKIGAVETIHSRDDGLNLAYNTLYRIRIALANGEAVCTLFDAGGTQLSTYTLTIGVGAPAAGYTSIHNYAARATYSNVFIYAADGSVLASTNLVGASVSETQHLGGQLVDNGVFDSYADGNNGSYNGWTNVLIKFPQLLNFKLTGKIIKKSGRLVGLNFRANGKTGDGYYLYWDNGSGGGTVSFRKGKPYTGGTAITTQASQGLLAADTEYPFTLTVIGEAVTWVINSKTFIFTADGTYNSAGFIGFVNLLGRHQVKDLVLERK